MPESEDRGMMASRGMIPLMAAFFAFAAALSFWRGGAFWRGGEFNFESFALVGAILCLGLDLPRWKWRLTIIAVAALSFFGGAMIDLFAADRSMTLTIILSALWGAVIGWVVSALFRVCGVRSSESAVSSAEQPSEQRGTMNPQ